MIVSADLAPRPPRSKSVAQWCAAELGLTRDLARSGSRVSSATLPVALRPGHENRVRKN